jgi:hypothetical protein
VEVVTAEEYEKLEAHIRHMQTISTQQVEEIRRLKAELNEVWVDEHGTAWTRPTAWAYAQVCRVKTQLEAKVRALHLRLEDEP